MIDQLSESMSLVPTPKKKRVEERRLTFSKRLGSGYSFQCSIGPHRDGSYVGTVRMIHSTIQYRREFSAASFDEVRQSIYHHLNDLNTTSGSVHIRDYRKPIEPG